MKNLVVTLALSAIGLVVPYASYAAGVAGYLDPSTGTFTPAMIKPIKAKAATTVIRTGTVKIVVDLTFESAIGTDEAVTCYGSINSSDNSFDNSVSTTVLVNRTSATAGAATLVMPYDWTQLATGEDVDWSLNCTEGSSYSAGGVSHSIYFTGGTFVVPATAGTVTTITKTATM